jgi:hypothetical protein
MEGRGVGAWLESDGETWGSELGELLEVLRGVELGELLAVFGPSGVEDEDEDEDEDRGPIGGSVFAV